MPPFSHPLVLIRGLPGSGKTTLAKQLTQATGAVHFETDQYFTSPTGEYSFSHNHLTPAHAWCQRAVAEALLAYPVVVANTFSRLWEISPYFGMVPKPPMVICCTGEFHSTHSVPAAAINAMRQRWEAIPGENLYREVFPWDAIAFLQNNN